jgi:uncharacterized protein (DUF1800 family)
LAADREIAMSPTTAAVAIHRFGLGEPSLDGAGADPQAWLASQIGPADTQRGEALPTAADALRLHAEFLRRNRQLLQPADGPMRTDVRPVEQQFAQTFQGLVQADMQARLVTAVTTTRPFAERLALFWSNHFTVSLAKASARGLVGCFEREAIRPFIAGDFETLLNHAVTHAAMLRYLDNHLSAGPHSRLVARLARRSGDGGAPRTTGLNENLAREVLELHTLGVHGGYTQEDVTSFAAVLTGWRVPQQPRGDEVAFFDAAWHEPGSKRVLGKVYPEGSQALPAVLHDLAHHPSTARLIATKLARHFVADEPPPSLVDRLGHSFERSGGDLSELYRELLRAPEAWTAQPAKLKTPEEFVVSSARMLGMGAEVFRRSRDGGIGALGQRVQAAPSPAGWPDRADDWLGPDAVWKRVEWATRASERLGSRTDARRVARDSLGPLLSENSAQQIDRAADGPQALALLLLSPEFQRR